MDQKFFSNVVLPTFVVFLQGQVKNSNPMSKGMEGDLQLRSTTWEAIISFYLDFINDGFTILNFL